MEVGHWGRLLKVVAWLLVLVLFSVLSSQCHVLLLPETEPHYPSFPTGLQFSINHKLSSICLLLDVSVRYCGHSNVKVTDTEN